MNTKKQACFLLVCAIFLCAGLYAQKSDIQVKGLVLDSTTGKPFRGVSVLLVHRESRLVYKGMETDENGGFTMTVQKEWLPVTRILFSHAGYHDKEIPFPEGNTGIINTGTITLSPVFKNLAAIAVSGRKKNIEQQSDRLVFTVSKEMAATVHSSLDILARTPLLSLGEDNVLIKGRKTESIFLNGKPMSLNILKSIPPATILRIEVITNPYPGSESDGISINIIQRPLLLNGYEGNIGGGLANRRKRDGNFYLGLRKNRITIDMNMAYNGIRKTGTTDIASLVDTVSSSQHSQLVNNQFYLYGGAGMNYEVDSLNNLGASFGAYTYHFDRNASISNTADPQTLQGGMPSRNFTGIIGTAFDLTYKHENKRHDKTLFLFFQLNKVTTKDTVNNPVLFNANNTGFYEKTARLKYSFAVKALGKLETGAKWIDRANNSDYIYSKTGATANNSFRYDQQVVSAYLYDKIKMKAGLHLSLGARLDYTKNHFRDSTNTTHDYWHFIPFVILSKTFTGDRVVKLSYTKSVQRPGIDYLNPYLNSADPYNTSQGNPYLLPEIKHRMELDYSFLLKGFYLDATLVYELSPGVITGFTVPAQSAGSFTTWQNVGRARSYGLAAALYGNIVPKWEINISTYLEKSAVYGQEISNSGVNYQIGVTNTFRLLDKYRVGVSANYLSRQISLMGYYGRNFSNSVRVTRKFAHNKVSASLVVTDPLNMSGRYREYYSGKAYRQLFYYRFSLRTFGLSVSYSFGKKDSTTPYADKNYNDDLKLK